MVTGDPCERVVQHPKGWTPHVENHCLWWVSVCLLLLFCNTVLSAQNGSSVVQRPHSTVSPLTTGITLWLHCSTCPGGQGKWAWLYRKEPYRHRLEMNVFFSCQKVLPQPLKNAEVIPTAGAAQCRPVLLTLVLTSICRKDCKDSPDCPQTQSFKMCYLKVLNYSKHFIARKNTREKKTQLGCPFALRM